MKTIRAFMLVPVLITGFGMSSSYAVVPPVPASFTQSEKTELKERLAGIETRLEAVEKDLKSVIAMTQGE